jgi:hypothetical protein
VLTSSHAASVTFLEERLFPRAWQEELPCDARFQFVISIDFEPGKAARVLRPVTKTGYVELSC